MCWEERGRQLKDMWEYQSDNDEKWKYRRQNNVTQEFESNQNRPNLVVVIISNSIGFIWNTFNLN